MAHGPYGVEDTAPDQAADHTYPLPPAWPPPPAGPPSTGWPAVRPGRPPGGPPRGGGAGVLVGVLIAVLVLALGAGAWLLLSDSDDDATSTTRAEGDGGGDPVGAGGADADATKAPRDASTGATRAAPSTTAAPTPTQTAEERANDRLRELRTASLPEVVLDGRYVAQVSSKSVGITDPLQVAANGSHTFYAADIVAEIDALRTRLSPDPLLLVTGADFGKYSVGPGGQPFWIGLVDGGFGGAADVEAWCRLAFPELSGSALENTCAVRTLDPSHP